MENTRQHAVNAASSLDSKFSDLLNELRQTVTEKNAAQDTRADEVNRAVQQHYEYFTDVATKLAKRTAEKDSELERLIESHRGQATEGLANLHTRMKEDNDRVMDVVVKDYEVVTQKIAEVDRTASDRDAALDQKYSEASRSLDAKLSAVEQSHNERLDSEHANVINQCQSLEQAIESSAFGQEKKAIELNAETMRRVTQLTGDLDERIDNEHRHFSALTDSVSEAQSSGDAALDSKFAEICSKLDRKFTDSCAVIDEQIQHNFKELSSVCGKLDQSCVQANAKTEAALTQSLSNLEKSLVRKNEQQDRNIAAAEKHVGDVESKLGARVTAERVELEQQQASDRDSLHKQLAERAATLDDRIEAEHKLFTDIIGKLDWKTSEALNSAVDKFSDAQLQLGEQLSAATSELDDKVESKHAETMDAQRKLEQETQQAALTLAASVDEAKQELGAGQLALEKKLGTQLEAMNTRVKKEMEPKLAEAAAVADRAVGAIDTLKTRVALEQEEQDQDDEVARGLVKDLDDLGEKVDGMSADLDIRC